MYTSEPSICKSLYLLSLSASPLFSSFSCHTGFISSWSSLTKDCMSDAFMSLESFFISGIISSFICLTSPSVSLVLAYCIMTLFTADFMPLLSNAAAIRSRHAGMASILSLYLAISGSSPTRARSDISSSGLSHKAVSSMAFFWSKHLVRYSVMAETRRHLSSMLIRSLFMIRSMSSASPPKSQ